MASVVDTGASQDTPSPPGGTGRRRSRGERLLGRHPMGWLFATPYLVFVLAIFAYPLVFAGYMSPPRVFGSNARSSGWRTTPRR